MLIFDFDGVPINSLAEVALITYNAVTGKLFTSLAALPEDLCKLFKRNRFHIQEIGDAIPLMNWCLKNYQTTSGKILTQDEYQTVIARSNVALLDRTSLIYETRKHVIEKDPKSWIALHKPYQPIWDAMMQPENHPFVILTNKNRDATLRLCSYFGLNLEEANLYAGDHGLTKAENMTQIQDRFGCELFFFTDDSVKNLQELDNKFNKQKRMLALLFASWGYTGPEDAKIARECGYPVFNQSDMISLINKHNPMA